MHIEDIEFTPIEAEDFIEDPGQVIDDWASIGIAPLVSLAELYCAAYDESFARPVPCLVDVPVGLALADTGLFP